MIQSIQLYFLNSSELQLGLWMELWEELAKQSYMLLPLFIYYPSLVPNIRHFVVVLQVRLLALCIFILLLLIFFLQDPQTQRLMVFESESVGQSGLKCGSTAVVLKQLEGQE